MNNARGLFTIALISIISMSCRVGKTPVRKNIQVDRNAIKERYGIIHVDTPGGPLPAVIAPPPPAALNEKKAELANQLLPLWKKELDFTTFSGKAKMHFEARGLKHDVTSYIRIAKDDTIWVNVTALGGIVGVARVLVTQDSLFFINSIEKSVMKLTVEDANRLFPVPVSFASLQNIIIGNVINPDGKPTDATDFGGTLSLQVENAQMIQNATYNKTDSTLRTLQMLLKTGGEREGLMQYGNYELVTDRRFAKSRVVNVTNNGEPYFMEMTFTSAVFDEEVEFPFSIPKNYVEK